MSDEDEEGDIITVRGDEDFHIMVAMVRLHKTIWDYMRLYDVYESGKHMLIKSFTGCHVVWFKCCSYDTGFHFPNN